MYLFLLINYFLGYSIFVVEGDIPPCEADNILSLCPATQAVKPQLINMNVSNLAHLKEKSVV